jgi:hypothetical protein
VLAIDERLDVGDTLGSPARLRLTLLPDPGQRVRLHVKGLNCFVARIGERPSPAAALADDGELELWSPDRRRLDGVRCLFGNQDGESRAFMVGDLMVTVPASSYPAVLLDVGPGRELALLHRPRFDGGRR